MKWETPLAPSLPWYARLAHLALAAMMVLILAMLGMSMAMDRFSWSVHVMAGLVVIALAGHMRRVAWGRAMGSLFSVGLAFTLTAALLPDSDEPSPWLANAPLWLSWLIIVSAGIVALLPATIVGLRREWFSDTKW
ncbi:hypothetical protein [Massilia sp. CF038]|uniref:hypothetical protein n=1 Tax=Massilia sp. CF038 TaxID=1881045 RepID=UPI00093235A1|nr:hypothetical protein [Massilia sp. CF038]